MSRKRVVSLQEKSTNVRLIFVRTLLRLIAALSPQLAAARLEQLFLTPRRHPTPPREQAWLAAAQKLQVQSGQHRLAVWSWGQGPTVLLVHGWAGRGSQLGAFAAPLVAAGYRVAALDAPGHGGSTGQRSSIVEMANAVRNVARSLGPMHAIVAHSAGTAATTIALRCLPPTLRLVYLSPPADPGVFLYQAAGLLGLGDDIARLTQSRIERRFGVEWRHLRGPDLAPAMSSPLLVIHDREDREVPWEDGDQLATAWPGSQLLLTEGLGHRRILRDSEVVDTAVRFLTQPIPEA